MTNLAHATAHDGAVALGDGSLEPLLRAHHDGVEQLCVGLLAETLADDPRALIAHWRRLERSLLEHIAMEAELLVPGYARVNPADARAIDDDHARVVRRLMSLGLEAELHVIRESSVRSLIEMLRTHAAREDAGLYPWASRHLSAPVRAALRDRLSRIAEVA